MKISRRKLAAAVLGSSAAAMAQTQPAATTSPDAELAAGWNALFVGEIAETTRLVAQAAARMPVHLFSNTNAVHEAAWSRDYAQALRPFRRRFVSHEMGLRKPDRAAFEHVAREIGLPLGAILFFDDTESNVLGARAAGMPAVHVRSPQDVRRAVGPWLVRPASRRGAV